MSSPTSTFLRTSQACVRDRELDRNENNGIDKAMTNAEARTASLQFQLVWDALDELRAAKGVKPETVAAKCGFARTAWFDYRRKGSIPFHLLERVAAYLGTTVQLLLPSAKLALSGSSGTNAPRPGRGTVIENYAEMFAGLLEGVPDDVPAEHAPRWVRSALRG